MNRAKNRGAGSKSLIGVLAGLSVVAAAGLTASDYVLGGIAEKQLSQISYKGLSDEPQVRLVEFKRGIFSSTAITEVEVPIPKQDPVRLRFAHVVSNGPRLGAIRAARVDTRLDVNASEVPALRTLFPTESPLHIQTDIGFDGSTQGIFESPALTHASTGVDDANVEWAGVQGHFSASAAANASNLHVLVDGKAPQLVIDSERSKLTLSNLGLSGDMRQTEFEGIWLGTGKFEIDSIAVASPQGMGGEIKQFAVTSDAAEQNGLLSSRVGMGAASASFAGTEIGHPNLSLTMSNLAPGPFQAVRKDVAAFKADPANQDHPEKVVEVLKQHLPEFLASKPIVSLDDLSFTLNGQTSSLSANVQYIGKGAIADFVPQRDLSGAAKLALPVPLAMMMLAGPATAKMAGNADPMATLQSLQRAGAVSDGADGVLRTAAQLTDGQITVNSIPLEKIMGQLASAGPEVGMPSGVASHTGSKTLVKQAVKPGR